MYRTILLVAAVLSAYVMAVPATFADDLNVCDKGTGDDAIAACSGLLRRNPKDAIA
jgi:hypothetical protein